MPSSIDTAQVHGSARPRRFGTYWPGGVQDVLSGPPGALLGARPRIGHEVQDEPRHDDICGIARQLGGVSDLEPDPQRWGAGSDPLTSNAVGGGLRIATATD